MKICCCPSTFPLFAREFLGDIQTQDRVADFPKIDGGRVGGKAKKAEKVKKNEVEKFLIKFGKVE